MSVEFAVNNGGRVRVAKTRRVRKKEGNTHPEGRGNDRSRGESVNATPLNKYTPTIRTARSNTTTGVCGSTRLQSTDDATQCDAREKLRARDDALFAVGFFLRFVENDGRSRHAVCVIVETIRI